MQLNLNMSLLLNYILKVFKKIIKDINKVICSENPKYLIKISALNKLVISINRFNDIKIFKEKKVSDSKLKIIYSIPY